MAITAAEVDSKGSSVGLRVAGLRPLFVHELTGPGVRNRAGEPLLHADAYYTLNRIPSD